MNRSLATLLRSLQTSPSYADALRLLGPATALLFSLTNPLNITLLSSQLLAHRIFFPNDNCDRWAREKDHNRSMAADRDQVLPEVRSNEGLSMRGLLALDLRAFRCKSVNGRRPNGWVSSSRYLSPQQRLTRIEDL